MSAEPPVTEAPAAPLRVQSSASLKHQNVLLAAVLFTLHGAIAWDIHEWWARGLMMAHFGLFLIWQPVWRGAQRIQLIHALAVLGLGLWLLLTPSVRVWLRRPAPWLGGLLAVGVAKRRQAIKSA